MIRMALAGSKLPIIIVVDPNITMIRVYGIAGRGTALIAVSGKGSFYDPPVRVSFPSRSYMAIWQNGNLAICEYGHLTIWQLSEDCHNDNIQGVTLDLAAPEEHQLVGQWGNELQNPHDVAISR